MADVTRRIGLSLGADLCWPKCYEEILNKLDLSVEHDGDTVRFDVDRVTIEPYSLEQGCEYDIVIDRLTHWYHTSREWIKKSILMDDLYVYNNPWSLQSMEKQTTYCAMMKLGLPVPETWMVPPKSYEPHSDLDVTLERYAKMFDLGEIGDKIGYPMFMKPYDGGAWKGVSRIDDAEALRNTYEESGTSLMHLQKSVEGFDRFVRCIGIGPQFLHISYDPAAPLHGRYEMKLDFLNEEEKSLLEDMAMTINSFFGWDFNSCESLHRDGIWAPIDFANACPDSQVTSLHYFFPWLVMANIRWSTYCAATNKKMRQCLDWEPYWEISRQDMTYREKLSAYAAIGHQRMETDRFNEFCERNLGNVEEQTYEFFGTDLAKDTIRQKVAALFPEHEVDSFTEHFWERIQNWRNSISG
ncbi:MAG: hypothetical protein ACI87E_005310 [Mariniblastus sp.]|jgi:hypothetical protein